MVELSDARVVLDALDDMDYPASKQRLVAHAERSGASPEAVAALRALPLADYASRDEVARSLPVKEDVPPDEKARQARDSGHQRIAEHLREPEDRPFTEGVL